MLFSIHPSIPWLPIPPSIHQSISPSIHPQSFKEILDQQLWFSFLCGCCVTLAKSCRERSTERKNARRPQYPPLSFPPMYLHTHVHLFWKSQQHCCPTHTPTVSHSVHTSLAVLELVSLSYCICCCMLLYSLVINRATFFSAKTGTM